MKPTCKPLLCLIVASLSFVFANAQEHAYKHYTVNEGLPSSEIYQAYQNEDGFIYFVTDRGISRFDGYAFKNYTLQDGLPNNTVFGITEDHKNRLWFSSLSGHIFYHKDDTFKVYPPPSGMEDYFNQWRFINYIFIDKADTIWLALNGHRQGFVKRHVKSNFLNKQSITDNISQIQLKYAGNGKYLAASFELGQEKSLLLRNNQRIQLDNILRKEHIEETPNSVLENDSAVYMAFSYTVVRVNKFDNSYQRIRFNERVTKCFDFDSKGNLWVGLLQKGIFKFEEGNLDRKNLYLKGESVSSILEDREGGFWFTTLDNGVFYLPWEKLFHYKDVDGACNSLACIASDIWAGFIQGNVIHYKNGAAHNTFKLPEENTMVQALTSDQKKIFVNASNEILTLQNNTVSPLIKSKGLYTRKLYIDKDGDLWGLGNGFYRIEKDSIVYASDEENQFQHWTTAMLKENDSSYLLGTFEGVWKFDGTSITPYNFGHPILKQRISDIKKVGGTYIFSTIGNGILIKKDGRYFHLKKSEDELLSNVCNSLYIENDSTFWASTNHGISRISGSLNAPYFNITHITKDDNLWSDEIHEILIKNENVWSATNKGLLRFDKSLFNYDQYSIPFYLMRFEVNGKKVSHASDLKLNYGENNIKLDFIGLFFKNNKRLVYRYRLKPNSQWTYTKTTSVQLINLSEGNYQLELEASINQKNWFGLNTKPAFTILPPFWKTVWFQISIFVMTALVIWIVFNNRFRSLKKKSILRRQAYEAEHKALRAQINPHFLFNSLNAINSSILSSDKFTASNYLAKFSKLMRLTLNNSIDSAVTLQKELDTLELYLAMEVFRVEKKFIYNIAVDAKIKPERCRIPAMLIQPFVENAIWHGLSPLTNRKGKLTVDFSYYGPNALKCIVEDNGIGRKAAKEFKKHKAPSHRSHGMSIIRKRLEVLSALNDEKYAVEVFDKFNEQGEATGTRVQILIPLNVLKYDQSSIN